MKAVEVMEYNQISINGNTMQYDTLVMSGSNLFMKTKEKLGKDAENKIRANVRS